jgi:hypothetical protein
MGLSLRLVVIDENDQIYRLGVSKFQEMLRNPRTHRYILFAGQRVRAAEAVVELIKRKPVRVVRMTFDILTFDREGYFDTETFDRHQFSRFASATSAQSGSATEATPGVVDASNLFTARGGRWSPAQTLVHTMQDAVLGSVKCPRL